MTAGRVVVTGAAGFLGSRLCADLLDEGRDVLGIDSFDPYYARELKERAVAGLRPRRRFRLHEVDVRDPGAVAGLLHPDDVIVHLAARAGVRQSVEDPASCVDINVRGTETLLETATRCGVSRVVFASSSSVYADGPLPFHESRSAVGPRSPYGASKLAGETACRRRSATMRVMCLRFFSVFGPGQRPDQAIHRFARAIATGRPIDRFGAGESARDYTFVDDAVRAIGSAIAWTDGAPAMTTVNVGSGRSTPLDEVLARLGHRLGRAPVIRRHPPHPADAAMTCADLSRARATLEYQPVVSFGQGLEAFLQWFEVAYGRQSRAAS